MKQLFLAAVISIATSACDDGSCEDARTKIQLTLDTICKESDYVQSPFCVVCISHKYYSIDDSCACIPLTLNASECYYAENSAAAASARVAIDQANAACHGRTQPILPCSAPDAAPACVAIDDASVPTSAVGPESGAAADGS